MKDVYVQKPAKCPGCGQIVPYGDAGFFTIEDENLPAKFIVVKGWICSDGSKKVIFGTVVRQGPLEDAQDIESPDHVYLVDLPGRTFFV